LEGVVDVRLAEPVELGLGDDVALDEVDRAV